MNMNQNEPKTIAIIREALAGVALLKAKCTFYAEKARLDGLDNVARFLEDSARHKEAHYKAMSLVGHQYGTTKQNLEELLAAEMRIQNMGPVVINVAMQEGFFDMVPKFERLITVSKDTTSMLNTLISQLDMIDVIKSEQIMWRCSVCGNIEAGNDQPSMCNVCESTNSFEELKQEIIKFVTGK